MSTYACLYVCLYAWLVLYCTCTYKRLPNRLTITDVRAAIMETRFRRTCRFYRLSIYSLSSIKIAINHDHTGTSSRQRQR